MELTTCQNLAEPLLLRLGYHNVSSDGSAAPSWGIAVEIGTPPQRFSLRPSIFDATRLSNYDHCSSQYDYGCLAAQGGVYNPEFSSTGNVSLSTEWNGTLGDTDAEDYAFYVFYNDLLRFGYNETEVWGFPFVTDDAQEWAYYGTLGVGMNSTFLHAAVESGAAPSMSWGLWVGSRSVENKQDGVLVVGGYDNARTTDFSTFDSLPECTTCIQIQNLTWVSDYGVIPLMNDTTTDFQVAVSPRYSAYTYAVSDLPVGSLSFTIKDGYTTSIPASELFQYLFEYDSVGNEVIANDTLQYAVVYNYTNENSNDGNYIFNWGLPFLTMNYLILDVEQQQFRLSEAIRQDFGNEGGVMPRKLCTGGTSPIQDPPPSSDGVNIGAIVGGVVGGVAVLLILALGACLCYRWKRTRSKKVAAQAAASQNQTYQPVSPGPPQLYPPPGAAGYLIPPGGSYPPQVPTGYAGHPAAGYAPMTQYEAPLPRQASYPVYSPPSSPPAPTASVVYSDTASTAVQELPSGDHNAREWRGSQVSGDTNATTKGLSEILTSETPSKQR
ncbi:hypothetical protein CLAIMM_04075 [Cladophialophora immunda]|nr:hypothetical protein CLAIMM_04075 [Cladophialophora immunda]